MAKTPNRNDKKAPPTKWWEQVPARDRSPVDVGRLTFDKNNPRFTPEKRPESDAEAAIITQLAATADLAELIQSISASGYIDIEPLIVIGRDDELVVLEGNRRLAALKVLTNPSLAAAAKIAHPPLSEAIAKTLKSVSVYRVVDESEARDLIGFKHINGPQVWDAYAKARYAARWLDDERAKRERTGDGLTIAEIAHKMGDNHDTIHRIVDAAYVLDQAEAERLFSVSDRYRKGFSFSHLYTALMYWEYRDFWALSLLRARKIPRETRWTLDITPIYSGYYYGCLAQNLKEFVLRLEVRIRIWAVCGEFWEIPGLGESCLSAMTLMKPLKTRRRHSTALRRV